ncbi:M20/M25/M40 family metallo-hydrolase [Paenibacillus sp. L3-i20]|uniref:M20/M25/M40 family metallo-hydrolase n=1 Tax=Paenibacillus sp. L3-i20 TaxID=2905833 RepID=UPI001EDE084B|nr:M20/M25/M40 family metallo-hydrolase [Paenibacillus sp. L3-i20]GKU77865.1 peptidase M20 [Paenibacillus sp. L3-i20]
MSTLNNPNLIYESPATILQHLIRFNTTNPPGDEADCIAYIEELLHQAGIETTIVAKENDRPNLIARIKGSGAAPPLLLYGHVDVVGVDKQVWSHDPFGGEIHDGYIWGRGSLDMKGGIAMMVSAFLRAHGERTHLQGDIILAIVSDEEAGGDLGASFLVDNYAKYFEGVEYAIGEFGGFSFQVSGRSFYPIMVAEKQVCWLRATLRSEGGHGSLGQQNGCMAQLGKLLQSLNSAKLPIHATPAATYMIESMAAALPAIAGMVLRGLLHPSRTDLILKLLGDKGKLFQPLLRNTVSATVVRGGEKINVHPSEIIVELDGRLLPGFTSEQFIAELRKHIIQDDVELEVIRYEPIPAKPNMGMFKLLSDVLTEADGAAIPVPMLLPGGTDARHFARLGIQTYGFLPMRLPEDINFSALIHAADERVPVTAIDFGAQAIFRVLERYGKA